MYLADRHACHSASRQTGMSNMNAKCRRHLQHASLKLLRLQEQSPFYPPPERHDTIIASSCSMQLAAQADAAQAETHVSRANCQHAIC